MSSKSPRHQNPYQLEQRKLDRMVKFLDDWKKRHPDSNQGEMLYIKRMYELRIREQSDKVRELSDRYIPNPSMITLPKKTLATKQQSIFIDIEDTADTRQDPKIPADAPPQSFFSKLKAKLQRYTTEPETPTIPTYLADEKKSATITHYLTMLIKDNLPATLKTLQETPVTTAHNVINRVLDYNQYKHKNKFASTEILPLDTSAFQKLIQNGKDPKPYLQELLKAVDKILPPLEKLFTPNELKQIHACDGGKSDHSLRQTLVLGLARLHLQDLSLKMNMPIHLDAKLSKNYRHIQTVLEQSAHEMNGDQPHMSGPKPPSTR